MNAGRMARAVLAGSLFGITLLWGLTWLEPFKLNTSASLPRGIYVRAFAPVDVGAIVWFPLPAAMRDYVAEWPATAAWFSRPANGLLKPVVAMAGDTICRDAGGVFSVNGAPLGVAPAVGPSGRALPFWRGCKRLLDGEIAVYSGRIADSIDSRLYGAIPLASARTYRPLWLFEPARQP